MGIISGEPAAPVAEPEVSVPEPESGLEPVVPAPAEEPDETESGATEGEDEEAQPQTPEQELQEFLDAVEELEKTDPVKAQALRERYAQKAEALTDEQRLEAAQQNVAARGEWVEEQRQEFSQKHGLQAAYGTIKALLDTRAGDISAKHQTLKASQKIDADADLPTLDTDGDARTIAGYVQRSTQEASALTWNEAKCALLDVIAVHPAARYLNEEERNYINAAVRAQDQYRAAQVLIGVLANAALRAAPEHAVAENVKVKEAETKAAAATQAVLDKIGGKPGSRPSKARGGAATNGKAYKDLTPEEQSKLTSDEIDAMTARFLSGTRA